MNATSSQELAKQLAHRFEEMNLQDPKKRAVFEHAYDAEGKEAILEQPRFQELLRKLDGLCHDMLTKDELDLVQVAQQVAQTHVEVNVNSSLFIEGCLAMEDLVKEKAPQLFSRFLKHIRRLKVLVTGTYDKLLEETRTRLQEVVEAQQQTIKELQTPIIPVWRGVLMAPLMGSFDSMRMHELQEGLLETISSYKPRFVLLDLSGLAHVDTNIVGELVKLIGAIRLLGTEAMLVGIKPNVAQQLTRIGARLEGIPTFATLEQGLRAALRELGFREAVNVGRPEKQA
jgi:anti-anti-sigma regulatory factor